MRALHEQLVLILLALCPLSRPKEFVEPNKFLTKVYCSPKSLVVLPRTFKTSIQYAIMIKKSQKAQRPILKSTDSCEIHISILDETEKYDENMGCTTNQIQIKFWD